MLWTEPVGATRMSDEVSNDDISVVRLGEAVFSSIRRFVVVKGSQYYCLCS